MYNHINNFEVINISYFWNISVIVDGVLIREINYRNYMPKYFYENIKSLIENESRYEEYLTKSFYELNKASLIPCHLDVTVSFFEIEPHLFKLNLFQIKNPKEVDIIKLEKFKFEQFYQVLLPNICYEKEDVLLSIGKLKNKYYFIFSSGKVLKFKGPV